MGSRNLEREEDRLSELLHDGLMSLAEYNAEMHELQRDYQAMAQEAAVDAYHEELERW